MTIAQFKAEASLKLNVPMTQLTMQQQKAEDSDELTDWVSSWDNDHRVRVTMHLEVFNKIKANPKTDDLSYKYELVEATPERAAYHRFVVITPTNILGTF